MRNGTAAAKIRADVELSVMLPTTKELKSLRNTKFLKITEAVNILDVHPNII